MRRLSFRRRQYLILLVIAIVPLAIAAGWILIIGPDFIIDHTTEQLETVADLKTVQVEQWQSDGRAVAELVASLDVLQVDVSRRLSPENEQVQTAIETIKNISAGVQSISLLHPEDGRVLLSTDPTQVSRIRRSETYFQAGQQALFISPVRYSIGREAPVVIISAPVRDERGALLAVAAIELNLTNLEAMIDDRVGLGQTGRAYLVEAHGFYVTRPYDLEGGPLRNIARSDGVTRALAGQNGSGVYLNPLGVRVLGVYRWLPQAKLGLLVEIEEAELTAEIKGLWTGVILITIGLLVLAVFAARMLTHWLVTPLEQIVEATRRLQTGDLDHRAPDNGPDEIGQLAAAFNEMADSVQLSHAELQGLVAHRTAELQAANEQFRSLIENALDIITVLDSEGVIRYESPSIERVLGYKPGELLGQNLFEFVHPDDLSDMKKTFMTRSQIASPAFSIEVCFRHKDGSWRIFEAIGRNLLNDPVVAGIVVNSRDITERRRLEDQLRQSQKMEAIGRLAGGVAHDFNNILTVITGYSAFLLDLHADPDDPERKDIQQIKRAGERAASLTRQLLAFSRQQILQPSVLNLNTVVVDVSKMLRRLIGEDIDLVARLDKALGQVKVDSGQIEQVILNLAINARDAMPQGGKLIIETTNVTIDEDDARRHVEVKSGSYVLLAVSDTGTGMDVETRSYLFEPFFTTKEPGQGTGLGLATVHGIINQSGGHIWVDSKPGQGATFKIYLPRIDETTESGDLARAKPQSLPGSGTILLVEDEDMVRDLTRQILTQNGYTVLTAGYGKEALQVCERYGATIHLLLTDVVMPGGMNGPQLAERVKSLRSEIKVLYMSGYTDRAIANNKLLEQDASFLQKPFSPVTLLSKVRQALALISEGQ